MSRYFIEVAYKGTRYSGFQIQENADTIQSEIEKAFKTLHRAPVALTGSSRTDAGVHALQNFFHFDFDEDINKQFVYKMNAILPGDIVVKELYLMPDAAHSRFDATSREYEYRIYKDKNPFLRGVALYYPYTLNMELMNAAAAIVQEQTNFFAFSKTNTQVKNFNCSIIKSQWIDNGDVLIYNIEGNRFLRGMVRLLTATILKVGRGNLTLKDFEALFTTEGAKCGHSISSDGLFLKRVNYPFGYFKSD
jgi:tRNA pseudouridine38-40 synthase